jgi:hypothetical protein
MIRRFQFFNNPTREYFHTGLPNPWVFLGEKIFLRVRICQAPESARCIDVERWNIFELAA